MILSVVFCIGLFSFPSVGATIACDIIIRVKSLAHAPFHAQIIAPSGNVTEMKLAKKNDRLIFQEKAEKCGLGQFQIKTSSESKEGSAKVTLTGTGSVNYEVGDDLIPKQVFRQGAQCQGQCAPLGVTQRPKASTIANASKSIH